MKILVTGGAGYIGSFTVQALKKTGHEVVVFDSLEEGHREAVPKDVKLIKGDLRSGYQLIETILRGKKIDCVVHFAAFLQVGESMANPGKYFTNNVVGSLNLLEAMRKAGVGKIVFSSTAAVYGKPLKVPLPEDHPLQPANVYGETKLMIERMLYWYHQIHQISSVSIRYFNACGAALDGSLGENHKNESHIIPRALKAALTNSEFTVFGDDYQTPDGTCIRDYIHVLDLAEAHVLAIEKINQENLCLAFNAGTGKGYSNKEVVGMVKKISGDFPVKIGERRAGDSPELVADSGKIKKELGWQPQYSDLETIIQTAHLWHKKQVLTSVII